MSDDSSDSSDQTFKVGQALSGNLGSGDLAEMSYIHATT